ncbi:unnamed protein product [Ectocarpus sp. CCAP 1310/34]|nr:unnamed protein product [Ectocarpus sp. CCAP 1310/34]
MAVCLLRAAGLGASRSLAFVARHQHPCSAAGRGKAWCSRGGRGGGSSASASRDSARALGTGVRMGAAINRTAIAKMRVAELREELASMGLDNTGLRPVLQVRLIEAKETEWAQAVIDRSRQRERSNTTEPPRAAGTNALPRPARSQVATSQAARTPSPRQQQHQQHQRGISTSSTKPGRQRSTTHLLQFDGGSRGNPGPSGCGAVLYRLDESGEREEVWSSSVWIGENRTNNEAEYKGLIEGLIAAEKLGIKRLSVEGDSNLVIQQMLGNYKVTSPKMQPLFREATTISKAFDALELGHILRAHNERADDLANIAMDTKKSSSYTHRSYSTDFAEPEE